MAEAISPSSVQTAPVGVEVRPYVPPWKSLWLRFRANRSARIGGIIVLIYLFIAIAVPVLNPYNALRDRDYTARFTAPSAEHPFGTDDLGRDILRRVGHGASVSLLSGVLVVSISLFIGTFVGEVAGFFGGWIDSVLMRLVDILLAFPSLLLAIVLVAIMGTGLQTAMIAVGIVGIPGYARLSRSMAISVRTEDYVMAAESVGASQWRILRQHVIPNSLSPIIVQATLGLGTAVISTAALGFLGLGQQPPYAELGKMLADSQQYLITGQWWGMVFPGVAITLVVLGFNLLGDGLRDTLDPKLRGRE